jgi:hypothetical protein
VSDRFERAERPKTVAGRRDIQGLEDACFPLRIGAREDIDAFTKIDRGVG